MAWHELRLVGVPRAQLAQWSAELFALGASGLQEDHLPGSAPAPRQPWDTGPDAPLPPTLLLRAWFENPDLSAVDAALNPTVQATWHHVADTDWSTSWRDGLGPVVISQTLTIAPPWDAPDGALVIEPGQGFGTGHHPSTVGALRALEAYAPGCRTALDVGCGSGVLALAAARLGMVARGVDVQASAIADAIRNARRNNLQAAFDTTPVDRVPGRWDMVLANLHAELLDQLAGPLCDRTGRVLIQAGILADRDAIVAHAFADSGLEPVSRVADGEWVTRVWARQ
ncbi:MAG: ribosomal protein L11 methyltransferase [Myxococcota bacterium]